MTGNFSATAWSAELRPRDTPEDLPIGLLAFELAPLRLRIDPHKDVPPEAPHGLSLRTIVRKPGDIAPCRLKVGGAYVGSQPSIGGDTASRLDRRVARIHRIDCCSGDEAEDPLDAGLPRETCAERVRLIHDKLHVIDAERPPVEPDRPWLICHSGSLVRVHRSPRDLGLLGCQSMGVGQKVVRYRDDQFSLPCIERHDLVVFPIAVAADLVDGRQEAG